MLPPQQMQILSWRYFGTFIQEDFLREHALLEKSIFKNNLFCEQIFNFSTGKNQTDRSPGSSPGRFLPASLSAGRKQIWQALSGQAVRDLSLLQAEPTSPCAGWKGGNTETLSAAASSWKAVVNPPSLQAGSNTEESRGRRRQIVILLQFRWDRALLSRYVFLERLLMYIYFLLFLVYIFFLLSFCFSLNSGEML